MSRQEIHSNFVQRFAKPRRTAVAPVGADDLHAVEEALNITFPTAYVAFLTQHGPVFTPTILDLVTGGESEQAPEGPNFDLQRFLKLDEIVETHRLYVGGGMEDCLAPVAMDSMGNVFGFKRERHQQRPDECPVFFFDHDFCKLCQAADAFDTWLASFLELTQ